MLRLVAMSHFHCLNLQVLTTLEAPQAAVERLAGTDAVVYLYVRSMAGMAGIAGMAGKRRGDSGWLARLAYVRSAAQGPDDATACVPRQSRGLPSLPLHSTILRFGVLLFVGLSLLVLPIALPINSIGGQVGAGASWGTACVTAALPCRRGAAPQARGCL